MGFVCLFPHPFLSKIKVQTPCSFTHEVEKEKTLLFLKEKEEKGDLQSCVILLG